MKIIAGILDNVNVIAKEVERSTRRKKRLRREHILGAFRAAQVIANAVAVVVPKARPVAVVLNALDHTVPSAKDPQAKAVSA